MLAAMFGCETSPVGSSSGSESPSNGTIRVLVVDDNVEMRSALEEIFTMEGFSIDSCDNGASALDRVLHQKYDVLVSDIRLPGLDGIELTRRVQALPDPPRIILVTAYPGWHVRKQGFHSYEVFDLMEKPLDLALLVQRVREAGVTA